MFNLGYKFKTGYKPGTNSGFYMNVAMYITLNK